jgi:hypothetical protein
MVEMIRGSAPLDGEWFAGGPALTPLQQIGIYKEQYRLRIYDALLEEIPGTAYLLGDDAETVLWRYLDAHPSTSFTLNALARSLPGWLEADGASDAVVDMARLDDAVGRGFEAAEGVPLAPEDLAGDPVLVLAPPVSLVRLRTNVHLVRSAVVSKQEPGPWERRDVPLVVFRRELKMRHLEVEPWAWALLDAFRAPTAVSVALEALVAGGADPDALMGKLGGWFQLFAERGLLQRGG